MKLKRFLSLLASAAIMATTVTTVTVPAAAAPTTLFSDDFDSGYTDNKISKHSGNDYSGLTGNVFETSDGIGISSGADYFYLDNMAATGDADNVFVLKDNAGVGSNNALNVTTQAGLNSSSWMVKNSGITSDTINGKVLTFTADIMIPADNGFNKGNGVFVYLDALGADNKPTTNTSFGKGLSYAHYENESNKDGTAMWKKTLLGVESWNWWTPNPCIIAFGEKVQNIDAGTKYSYKLTLTPNSEGKYTAKASVNGTEYELVGTNLPTVEEMSAYKFAMIAEKANPYNIKTSYTSENKYQNDKTIALLDNLSLTAAVPAPESDVLYSDNFNDYTAEYVDKAAEDKLSCYDTDKYTLRYNVESREYKTTVNNVENTLVINKSSNPQNIAKLVADQFGTTGSKSLQLTSQGLVVNGSMYKPSNITEDKIKDKALVFNAKFKIPEDGMYNRGVGFAAGLSPVTDGKMAPDAACGSENLTLDQGIGNKYKFFATNGLDFYVFDKQMWTLEKGKEYSYTLKLYPNGDGTYKAAAALNGNEILVDSANIPTKEELKTYSYSYIALHNHGWYTYAGSKNPDGTSSYKNDEPLVFIDDVSLERKNPNEVTMPKPDTAPTDEELGAYKLLDEGFEDYTGDYVKKASANELSQYQKNSFILNYNASSTETPKTESQQDGRIVAGDITKLGKISKDSRFGSGKNYLNIQSQALVQHGTMWQRSNITADRIANKTLVFKTKFMIPSDSQWGRGFGAAVVLADTATGGKMPNGSIGSIDMSIDQLNDKYSFAQMIGNTDSATTTFRVFGENIATDLAKGTVYDVTVTMVPNTDGKYMVTAKLNDEVKTLAGKKTNTDGTETETIPTVSELGGYAFAGVTVHTNGWNTSYGFSTSNKYQPDRDLIYFDDISLKRANNFVLDTTKGKNGIGDLTTEGKLDMAKKYITLNLGEAIDKVDAKKITIDNGATVDSAVIDTTDSKKLKITFDNLKLNTGYTINIAGVVNPIGVEYSDTLSLRTSAGIDVDYANIKLEEGTDGKKKVTVPVTKQTGITDTVKPAVIVYVYDGSNTDAPLIKHAYAKEEEVTTNKNIEVTGIEVGTSDKVRVFVWDGFSSMKPLTQRKDLN